ncbi:neuropeptide receptor 22 isoform X2 [Lepeophtheirus salmonis]|uniref:neuropeptide receptor 22 isoform X2 n=1 Tax=Lepeophtheirus salmonis TaxID=72036 RepID=UPI001AE6E982|nr:prolactin-releasing peptide receptor-like isoform X2 [Lepeophtheirus salmonis]
MSEVIDVGATSTNSVAIGEYHLGDDNKWGWITLYIVTIVFAILGNFLFLIAAACTTRVRSTGYYLLINLSIRDILLAGLCMPFALDYEIIHLNWIFGLEYCISFRFFYYCFLFFLPLTILFLTFHLFVENCKWNFAGEEGYVPRPWTHSIYITLIWFFSVLFAVPTAFFSEVRDEADDFYGNDISGRPTEAKACLHRGGNWNDGSNFFYMASSQLTFCIPVVLLVVPWFALLVQICSCCTRKLNKSELWLSVITLLLIILWEISRAPLKLFNIHHILTSWEITKLTPFLPPVNTEIYRALMKWAIYAPAAIHPLIYFAFSPEVRHGAYILFSRCCSCCCSSSSKSGGSEDGEIASDDEKGRMLPEDSPKAGNNGPTTPTVNTVPTVTTTTETIGTTDSDAVPLQSKQEDEM